MTDDDETTLTVLTEAYYSSRSPPPLPGDENDDEETTPRPVSPAGGAESLFLAGLTTNELSQEALRRTLTTPNHALASPPPPRSISAASVLTDDFQSCVADATEDDEFPLTASSFDSSIPSASSSHPRQAFDHENNEHSNPLLRLFSPKNNNNNTTMSTKLFSSPKATTTTSTVKMPKVTTTAASTTETPDVAEHLYTKAKDIWAWGKGVPLVSLGLGMTEAFVGKAVGVVGLGDLAKLDTDFIQPNLAKVDAEFLNPAIHALIEDFLKPFLTKVGLLKNEAENPEVTLTN